MMMKKNSPVHHNRYENKAMGEYGIKQFSKCPLCKIKNS